MKDTKLIINSDDILALIKVIDLIEEFIEKNIIRKYKVNFSEIKRKAISLKSLGIEDNEKKKKQYHSVLKKLSLLVKREHRINTFFVTGAHGGVIINDIGFCEFDSPDYAIDILLKKMQLAIETNMPYSLEIAICCLEWLSRNSSDKFSEFLRLFNLGKFEIINPTYSQPYNLIIGSESNIKQFEYGLKNLKKLGLSSNIYYCSESSIHPQIPQILRMFNIMWGSLRTRLMGVNPTSNSASISWVGLDNTKIDAIIDQSGVFNGEYWHGTFFKEIPNLLFQAVARPFMDYIVYSSFEDYIIPQPYQEEIWRVSQFSEIFGKFLLFSEFFQLIDKEGEYKYHRDDFLIGDFIFIASNLFLQNKNSEISIITSEILNCTLGLFNRESNDSFLEELWKKLLLTQAHDCYAVPFIRSGDYSQAQLNKEEFDKLNITESNISISELCFQIHADIQKQCNYFIKNSLKHLSEEFYKEKQDLNETSKNILVFNPTPYSRKDLISVQLKLDNRTNRDLFEQEKRIDYYYRDSTLKFISDIPGFGYKIYTFMEKNIEKPIIEPSFLYELKILEDLKTIEIKYKNSIVYELKFQSSLNYELLLKEEYMDNVEKEYVIIGETKNYKFKIKIIQYNEVNRLEFFIDSNSLKEVILTPKFKIENTFINYPFGIEETKRSKIQTLDFLWLKGYKQGIIFIQKNSQKFIINRENFETRNLLFTKGKFEFAISITDETDSKSPLFYVNSFYFKLLGIDFDGKFELNKISDSFLSVKPSISVINLWRRENSSYLRLFNPSNKEVNIQLDGELIKNQLKELDFNYNEISLLESNELRIRPWKIKMFKL